MAQRASDKTKRAAASRPAKTPGKTAPARPAGEGETARNPRIAALEQERDRLAAELAAAKARIAKLEEARSQVVNRIDWVIDSLHNLIEDES